jgi:hypothetical protein
MFTRIIAAAIILVSSYSIANAAEPTALEQCIAQGGAVAKASIISPDGSIRVITRCVKVSK